ncbi:IclR family transcriptional regulator [Corynebacterium sp. HMSC29G08]|uniref:IclR family transcriptional regulator n=1 Tax=Corynebacterium sp. HMSC29G08 TaxID=1581069 RepID=UPI0008A4AA7D|nr:IclR family transcriptional regulator [Corynebacterium sp. HMSC29G08]
MVSNAVSKAVSSNSANADQRGSIDKAFALIRAFQPEDVSGVGVSELARRASLSKSTAHRLLNKLVENEAVFKADDMYRLNPGFGCPQPVESQTEQGERVSEILTPFLAALFEQTRRTVHLGYIEGTNVRYANKLFSVRGVTAPSRIGGLIPAYVTGVGKAIMAHDQALTERVIRKGLVPWTEHTITDPKQLAATLERVREEGVAYDRQEIAKGLCCVAAPIYGASGPPVAAMSVSFAASEFNPDTVIPILKKICAAGTRAYRRETC